MKLTRDEAVRVLKENGYSVYRIPGDTRAYYVSMPSVKEAVARLKEVNALIEESDLPAALYAKSCFEGVPGLEEI